MRTLLIIALLSVPGLSSAQIAPECGDVVPELVWSYPAKGTTDVPRNSVLWAMPSRGFDVKVAIDGRDVPPDGATGIDAWKFNPGPLSVGEHKLAIEVGNGSTFKKIPVMTFTVTDIEAQEAPEGPAVNGSEDATSEQDGSCAKILAAQTCFATPPAGHLRLDLAPTGVFWTVSMVTETGGNSQPILWPSECAAEAFTVGVPVSSAVCYEATSLDAAGNESEPIGFCPHEETGDGSTGGGRGAPACSAAPLDSANPPIFLIGLLFIVLAARRFF